MIKLDGSASSRAKESIQCCWIISWWRHHMETFSALLALCAGNSLVTGEFPAQRPVTQSFDVFFYLRLNKRLSKRSWGWWCETPLRSLWRHRSVKLFWLPKYVLAPILHRCRVLREKSTFQNIIIIVRRAGLLWSQQDFEWWWSVPLSSASLY